MEERRWKEKEEEKNCWCRGGEEERRGGEGLLVWKRRGGEEEEDVEDRLGMVEITPPVAIKLGSAATPTQSRSMSWPVTMRYRQDTSVSLYSV